MIGFYIASPLIILFLLYLFLIAPKKMEEMEKFKSVKYAHRGLHGNGVAENSMSAFRAAVDGGFGIELDVQLSRDGELVVFHDGTLDRVCGRCGKVIDFTADELSEMKLLGTDDGIPRFSEVLSLVAGKVPLLVEIKEGMQGTPVADAACKLLSEYDGPFIVESFNPLALKTVKKNLPKIPRGFLSQRYYDEANYRKPLYFALQTLLLNFVCRPAFISYNHKHASAFGLRFVRRFFGAATVAWTVCSPEDEKRAYENGFDGVIFENYIPNKEYV